MASKRTGSSCGPWYADPEHGAVNAKLYKGLFTSVAIVTSQKLFSSLRCLKEATMLVWKSFQRRQNCWSSAIVGGERSETDELDHRGFRRPCRTVCDAHRVTLGWASQRSKILQNLQSRSLIRYIEDTVGPQNINLRKPTPDDIKTRQQDESRTRTSAAIRHSSAIEDRNSTNKTGVK